MNPRMLNIKPSASGQMMAKAKEMQKVDPSIISLAGGEPDFITPAKIRHAAQESMEAGNTHYVMGPGILPLRKAIQKKLLEENNIECDENCILLTPGGKNAIYLAMQVILAEGDEVMILDPAWVSYEPMAIMSGAVPVHVKLNYANKYEITRDLLENAMTDKTRLLIVNYPNNPTGRILHRNEADVLEQFLLAHPQVTLISDEVYEKLSFDGQKGISMASYPSVRDRVVTINGFSKCAAMTGWRMGYMVAPKEIFNVAYKLYSQSLSCMSGFLQVGAVEVFNCEEEMEAMRKSYEDRRNWFCGGLNEIPGVHCEIPEGAFYAWVSFDGYGKTSEEMCTYLLEEAKIVGMPGTAYGEEKVCTMRFSFASADDDLHQAIRRIGDALALLRA